MRILAVHAHPDDVEFLCAGTLALLAKEGHEIHIATLSNGDLGSVDVPPDELAEVRKGEARESASMIGATYTCLDFRDFRILVDHASRQQVTELLRRIQPEIVITASPQDYMSDHEYTSALVRDACFFAPTPNYATGAEDPAPPMKSIPYLYYTDPIEGRDFLGNPVPVHFIVDISETIDVKERMLKCHASQREWLLKHHGVDEYIEPMKRWSAHRGKEIGTAYGEAFRQHLGHAYPQDNVLKKLLGEKVHPVGRTDTSRDDVL